MTKANPIDGVWFILAHLGKGPLLPEDIPQDYYLVCTTILDGNWPVALWFPQTVRTCPNDLNTRNQTDRWASECLEWWNRGTQSGKPFDQWVETPPHNFLFADSNLPGNVFSFDKEGSLDLKLIQKISVHFVCLLRSVWPTWCIWGDAEGIPVHPSWKTATFHEEDIE
jgi:hypothetical protein